MKNKIYFIKSFQVINILIFLAIVGLLLEHASHKTLHTENQSTKATEYKK